MSAVNSETLKVISAVIGNVGFPVFVAVWLLVRTDKATRELTKAIRDLTLVVDKCKWRE